MVPHPRLRSTRKNDSGTRLRFGAPCEHPLRWLRRYRWRQGRHMGVGRCQLDGASRSVAWAKDRLRLRLRHCTQQSGSLRWIRRGLYAAIADLGVGWNDMGPGFGPRITLRSNGARVRLRHLPSEVGPLRWREWKRIERSLGIRPDRLDHANDHGQAASSVLRH